MADQKISELTAITGANTADDDLLVIVDTSASQTKKITLGELENALAERDFNFGDNDKLVFGAGNDLQIYHDGSNSYITDAGVGNLYVKANVFRVYNAAGDEISANFVQNGAVTLYYDNAIKLATTSTGIDVTGTVTSDGLTTGGNIFFDSTSGALRFRTDAGVEKATARLATNDLKIETSGLARTLFAANGDISFYEDTGTTAKFFWDASAEVLEVNKLSALGDQNTKLDLNIANTARVFTGGLERMRIDSSGNVGIGTSSPANLLHIRGGAATLEIDSSTNTANLDFDNSTQTARIQLANNDLATLVGGTERMRIDSSGNVGIATSSPATTLDVAGTTTTDGLNLDAISETISDTAKDVFVYDTRKDSDGGAWRKRTQHTSWYNETLNTATRGSRKEFPAVAVIVTDSYNVTIYDGDDPDLPMWLKFEYSASDSISDFLNGTTGLVTSVSMKNGVLAVGATGGASFYGHLRVAKFLDDTMHKYMGYYNQHYVSTSPISERNGNIGFSGTSNTPSIGSGIVDGRINDVAMTVLPNAPIDAATGLPVPTIAVATDGGVSVIKDDGTVVDITHSDGMSSVVLDGKNRLVGASVNLSYAPSDSFDVYDIPSSDITSSNYKYRYRSNLTVPALSYLTANAGLTNGVVKTPLGWSGANYRDEGGNKHPSLVMLETGSSSQSKHMAAYVETDYNTGWMNGDIKLATLSDTDDTNVTGSELVTNGTFDTDTSGWNVPNGTFTSIGGRGFLTNTSSYGYAWQSFTTVVGRTYTASADFDRNSSSTRGYLGVGTTGGGGQLGSESNTTDQTGSLSVTFTATGTLTYVNVFGDASVGTTIYYDNISVRLAEEDRSVNGNGLQVFGTVTKSAVATGADLVAYSGFSNSNYLVQPYNSDLDFGTGDFCIMGWMKGTSQSSFDRVFERSSGVTIRMQLTQVGSTNVLGWRVGSDTINTPNAMPLGSWFHFCGLRLNGVGYVYINGNLEVTGSQPDTVTLADSSFILGNALTDLTRGFNGSLALWRISATAPSPEQILKIYNDEKHLFTEGAQATLYGSSDAVTALAYDDSTELLHVGTSAGRSVFQGLRRVDNTTTAVGAAISASNNLVAEE